MKRNPIFLLALYGKEGKIAKNILLSVVLKLRYKKEYGTGRMGWRTG